MEECSVTSQPFAGGSPRHAPTPRHEAEYDATPVFGRVRSALDRLYPRRVVSSVLSRIGLRRWLKSAAITDAMLTAELHGAKLRAPAKVAIRDLAEVNWETTLLPPVPPPATGRCLSEVSWEDHCLPPVGRPRYRGGYVWLSQVEIWSGEGLEISELAPWLDAPFQCATFEL